MGLMSTVNWIRLLKWGMRFAGLTLLVLVAVAGCNPTDSKELAEDAKKLGQTAGRAANNAQLAGRVRLALSQTKDVDISRVEIFAESGVVTLKGEVKTRSERPLMVRLVREIKGVNQVINKLVVSPSKK